jgi:hypothetical protein
LAELLWEMLRVCCAATALAPAKATSEAENARSVFDVMERVLLFTGTNSSAK